MNPWQEKERLPLLDAGLLGELIYGDQPMVIDDLALSPNDPAAEYLAGMRSLMAIPLYEHGQAINMVVLLRKEPAGFPRTAAGPCLDEQFVWTDDQHAGPDQRSQARL